MQKKSFLVSFHMRVCARIARMHLRVCVYACVRVCVCACALVCVRVHVCVRVCVWERERERWGKKESVFVLARYVCVCVCVCLEMILMVLCWFLIQSLTEISIRNFWNWTWNNKVFLIFFMRNQIKVYRKTYGTDYIFKLSVKLEI